MSLDDLEYLRESIAEERRTIMDSGDRDDEDIQEYDKLGNDYDNVVDRLYD